MPSRVAPQPSRASEILREYLDIFENAQKSRGKVLWYDVYRRAGNQWQTGQVIKYLEENCLIDGTKEEGYRLTEKGETWHHILKMHWDLVGVLTKELSGNRRKQL